MTRTSTDRFTLSRRGVLASTAALALTSGVVSAGSAAAPNSGFVTRDGMGLKLDGKPYRFVGANEKQKFLSSPDKYVTIEDRP